MLLSTAARAISVILFISPRFKIMDGGLLAEPKVSTHSLASGSRESK